MDAPRRILVTGAAGFIGCNTAAHLLELGQTVVGLDNFATGQRQNIEGLCEVAKRSNAAFSFVEADIRDAAICIKAMTDINVVIHLAALGSIPRSFDDPLATHQTNVDGFLNVLLAAKNRGIRRIVYASSSSVYGDAQGNPRQEHLTGEPLNPYAITKAINEQYARFFSKTYGMHIVGLRYFNVFGPRQNPNGPYAAVIPRWITALRRGEAAQIFGDGSTIRDFCYVGNVVQANILAATADQRCPLSQVFNIATGKRSTLLELHALITAQLAASRHASDIPPPVFSEFRARDIPASWADISKAKSTLGYHPTHDLAAGLAETIPYFS